MAHIIKIIRCVNKGERAKVYVQLDNEDEARHCADSIKLQLVEYAQNY